MLDNIEVKTDAKTGKIHLTIDPNVKLGPSSTKKTITVATSHGFVAVGKDAEGQVVSLSLNCFTKPKQ